jgi:hypothetical protein
MAAPYNYNPAPRQGRGAFGSVPGVVTLPPNLYEGVQSIYPGLAGNTNQAGNVIRHQLQGELSPETINTIQDDAARFGVQSGLPMTNFSGYRGLRNLGRTVEDVQGKGLENYNKLLSTLGPMMTDPALAAQIAAWNATMGAAPDPRMNADEMLRRYNQGLNSGLTARNPGGGTYRPPNADWFNGPAGGTGGGPIMITGSGNGTVPRRSTTGTGTEPMTDEDFENWAWYTSGGAFGGNTPVTNRTDWEQLVSDLSGGAWDTDTPILTEDDWDQVAWDLSGGTFGGSDNGLFGPYSGGYAGLSGGGGGGDITTDLGSDWDTWLTGG